MNEAAASIDPKDPREQIARIDNLLADTQKSSAYRFQPWQIDITLIAGGAAFFAAGAAFIKPFGG